MPSFDTYLDATKISTASMLLGSMARGYTIKLDEPINLTNLNAKTKALIFGEPWCMGVKKVIFNGPATIAFFNDGDKVVVKCHEDDRYDARLGLLSCIVRKAMHNRNYEHLEDSLREMASASRWVCNYDELVLLGNAFLSMAEWIKKEAADEHAV